MSVRQLRRRLERVPALPFVLRGPVVRAYLAEVAALHGVDADELQAEVEAMLRTWQMRNGGRLPAFDELLEEEAHRTGRTVAAVKAELQADLAMWARGGR